MDGIQGAVLRAKLKRLDEANLLRRARARLYNQLLEGVPQVTRPFADEYSAHVYHVYAIRVHHEQQKLMQYLAGKGVSCLIHYPKPIHLQPAYSALGLTPGSFPRAEICAQEFVSLPMFPTLSAEQVVKVTDEIKGFFGVKPAEAEPNQLVSRSA